jgi:hypothetical protein
MPETVYQVPAVRHERGIKDSINIYGRPIITRMPAHSSITQIRLDNIKTCLNDAVTTVDVLSKNLKTPFLEPIVNTMWSILGTVQVIVLGHLGAMELTNTHQKIKRNKEVCAEMLGQIHKLLYAIIQVHIASNTGGELTPKMLDNLGQFAE